MKRYLFYCFLTGVVFWSCKTEEGMNPINPNPETEAETETSDTPTATGDERYLSEKSDYIFDQDKFPTFYLDLPIENLAKIDGDPAAEEYVEGSLTFEGETIAAVGIRYKGSIGAFVGCLSGRDWANPSGYKTCTKLSMKVKINWENSDDKFYGLKKLQFHSMNNDDTQMRERLGYWLFRQMGVPAPRAVHSRLIVNGQYMGVFALVEQIDGRFTRYNYEDGEGNLYKEIWPLRDNGEPFSAQTYLDHLKTNEDESPTAEQMQQFAREVSEASDTELKAVVEKWMNIDEIMAYAAVDRTIRNDDGAFHWYCDGDGCAPHNFYWYEEPSAGTMHLIPWDIDHAFDNIIYDANPVTPIADGWGEITNDCEPFSSGFLGVRQRSAACDRLTAGWVLFEQEYRDKITEFKAGPFSEASISAQLEKWSAQIRDATANAASTHTDAISTAEWESAMAQLRSQVDYARRN